MNDFRKLAELCRNRNIYIQTHNFPDPDALGSAFALQRLLAHFDIEAKICCAGTCDRLSVSKMLDLFDIQITACEELRAERTEKETEKKTEKKTAEDAIICVDSQRYGGNIAEFTENVIACIDHHPTFVQASYEYAELCITGSCATLIAKYYQELGIIPEQDTATALLYGLRMDTLQFTRGVTQLDIEMFGFLFPLCDQGKLFRLEHNNMCLEDLRAYGAVIDSIAIYGKVGFAEIPFACPDGLVAALSDFILDLEEVVISVVCCQRPDGVKLSVRSEVQEIHAGYLLHLALKGLGDGGGHQVMAGGLVKKNALKGISHPETVIRERILSAFEEMKTQNI